MRRTRKRRTEKGTPTCATQETTWTWKIKIRRAKRRKRKRRREDTSTLPARERSFRIG
jgi:hypothetical protein